MNRKMTTLAIATMMLLVSFSLVSTSAPAEEVTAPFVLRNDGYPLIDNVWDPDLAGWDGFQGPIGQSYAMAYAAQSFTAHKTGTLLHIGIYVSGIIGSGNVQWDVRLGLPSGSSILGGMQSRLPMVGNTWNYFSMPVADLTLTGGQLYSFIVSTPPGTEFRWADHSLGPIPDGVAYESTDDNSWVPINVGSSDFTLRVNMDVPTGGIRKVAWHPSGNFALGVTGQDSAVWEYYRTLGSWSLAVSDTGLIFNDIIYEPVWDRFYAVGHDDGAPRHPIAYEINPYDEPMTTVYLGGPTSTTGSFKGMCVASEGLGPYTFLAVGDNETMPGALACWYRMGVGWVNANLGDVLSSDGHILYDVAWDQKSGGSYYAVGADGLSGRIYRFSSAGIKAPVRVSDSWANRNSYFSIEWQPITYGANYALLASVQSSYGNMQMFNGGEPMKLLSTTDTLYDVSWHPDGTYAMAVGQDWSGSDGVAYVYDADTFIITSEENWLPPGTGPLFGVALKGPSSPSSGLIVGYSGSISYYPSALNQDTRITANAAFPHLYWIGFNDTTGVNRMDQQVPVGTWYNFTLVANYSLGWSNCQVEVAAWFDWGAAGSGSIYPAEDASNRNLAFRLLYTVGGLTSVEFPAPDLEVLTGPANDNVAWSHPTDNTQDWHLVEIPVWIGPQIHNASGDGFSAPDLAFDANPDNALLDRWSWDFNVTVSDQAFATAASVLFGEFGIQESVSVTVAGNPSGNAPPGSVANPMGPTSHITYSSNTAYWVNVSIPNLYLGGNVFAADWIPTTDVMVQNIAPDADGGNSYISIQRNFPAIQNTPMNVWGLNATNVQPVGNGTVTVGPWISDFNAAGLGFASYTELQWWVTVQAGTPEGVYWGVITVTIDS